MCFSSFSLKTAFTLNPRSLHLTQGHSSVKPLQVAALCSLQETQWRRLRNPHKLSPWEVWRSAVNHAKMQESHLRAADWFAGCSCAGMKRKQTVTMAMRWGMWLLICKEIKNRQLCDFHLSQPWHFPSATSTLGKISSLLKQMLT